MTTPDDRIEGKVPPHDLPAERGVLSAVMCDPGDPLMHRPSSLELVLDILHWEHFYSEAHRRIFEACLALYAAGRPVDSVQVATYLREHDRLQQVGGMAYLAEVLLASPDHIRVRAWAQTVVDTHLVRRTIFEAQVVTATGYLGYGDAKAFVVGAADTFVKLSEKACSTSSSEHLREILTRTVKEIGASRGQLTGAPTGLAVYDRITAGLHPGDLTIVAARPGAGKTSLVTGWAESVARGDLARGIAPQGAAILSMEMPREQLANRMMCSGAQVDVAKLRGASGGLSPADWTRLVPAASRLGALPLWIDDQPSLTLLDIRAKVRWFQQQCFRTTLKNSVGEPLVDEEGKPVPCTLGLVAVDYLQLMEHPGASSREQAISAISRGLKGLAKELRLPVVALSQLNRNTEGRTDKRPQMADLRESGALEQDADNICFIYRDFTYSKDESKRLVAELIVAKQRNGATDTVQVRFDDRFTRFSDIPDSVYQDDPEMRTGSR